jgi:hypothetical protein
LSDRPSLEEIVQAQVHFKLAEPAHVEKDWFVVKALAAITAADNGPFELVFQGGTALSRAHRVIDRMSEDIDIKIVSEGSPPRSALRRLRESITAELLKAGFKFDPKNPGQRKSNYESRYTLYRLPYEPMAAGRGALRPEIKIETAAFAARRPAVERPVISFVAEAFKQPPEVPAIACAAIVETAAEKFVALTRRAGAERAGVQRTRDPTLIRHVYDLHAIHAHYDPVRWPRWRARSCRLTQKVAVRSSPLMAPIRWARRCVPSPASLQARNTPATTRCYSGTWCTDRGPNSRKRLQPLRRSQRISAGGERGR